MHFIHTVEQLKKECPEAYNALPEPYQNDNCLDFRIYDNGTVIAMAKEGQEHALGTGSWQFDPDEGLWETVI